MEKVPLSDYVLSGKERSVMIAAAVAQSLGLELRTKYRSRLDEIARRAIGRHPDYNVLEKDHDSG